MDTFLLQLAEIDRQNQEGSLSEYAYRRAKERLIADYATRPGYEPAHGLRDHEHRPQKAEDKRQAPDRTAGQQDRPPRPRAAGSPALDAFILFVVAIAFSELLAQGLGNGLPYHKLDGQLVYLPGPAIYVINALEGAGLSNPQIVLGALLMPCYLIVPWATYRSLSKGSPPLFAGFTIAFRYILVSALVAYVQLALLSDYPIDIESHLAIPALIGWGILGVVFTAVLTLRRLISN